MSKHTEGLWHVDIDKSASNWVISIRSEKGLQVATVNPYRVNVRMYDAALLAAAPRLLAALKNVRDNSKEDSPEMWAEVDAAITEAEEIKP